MDYLFKEHICGGVILDAITILSAAHCFYGSGELEIHQGKTGKEFANLEKFRVFADFIYNNGSAGQVRKKEIVMITVFFPITFYLKKRFVKLKNSSGTMRKNIILKPRKMI